MKTTARILVVDDDDHVREALVEELSPTYTVDAVGSATEALDLLALDQYDVVISDLKMPEHDGIEVLEFARTHQGDAVRVLLTGYLDERAHRALLSPDAPYKVGKPWHDEIEVVVRRGLEQRDAARKLNASFGDALRLSTLDAELGAATTALELADVVVRRCVTIEGVLACCAATCADGRHHVLTGGVVYDEGAGTLVDLPLDAEGALRLRARCVTDSARQLLSYIAQRAQRRCGVLEPRPMPTYTSDHPGDTRMNLLIRQATIGALTSSLLHDLASVLQSMSGALSEVRLLAEHDDQMSGPIDDACEASDAAVSLFVEMRKFIRNGEVVTRPIKLARLVDTATRMTGGMVRERAHLQVHSLPDVDVIASETLLVQVVGNLLRNAAGASPPGGHIDLEGQVAGDEVLLTVTDDGPGVDAKIVDQMFEPFATDTPDGTGLGLAIAAYVLQLHKGRISYRKHATRGACFQIALRRAGE